MSGAMVIGTNSRNTIFEIFKTGVHEVVRKMGLPTELSLTADRATIIAKSSDFGKRVEYLRVDFPVKEQFNPDEIRARLEETRIPNQFRVLDGKCSLTLPAFDWPQLPVLAPIDKIVCDFAAQSIRSQSWHVSIQSFRKLDFNINLLIEQLTESQGSDIHLRAGTPPYMRIDGDLKPLDYPPLSAEDMREIVYQLGGQQQVDILETEKESSFQYHLAGIAYLRCSGYIKMGAMALAVRFIPESPFPFDKLNLPNTIRAVADAHRGLFLVCGVTGSGKSTTLASLVDYINENRHAHIITIEDPIEFVYADKKSIISQRQIGRDTFSFANALRGALREDPDTILVGEMRDRETIRAAISAASTGHLVFSTLHTMTAVDTVNRIISYFPHDERDVIRQELAYTLKGVCCQRLLKRTGGGRIPCIELLLCNLPMVRDAILEGDIQRLYNIIEVDSEMKSFDQYAVELFRKGLVTREEAISACADEEAFIRVTTGIKGTEGRKLLR
ncbi:MAG: PilT/PilU family type 4a pilus ATPase [Candidatus Hydrogenedentes bacterium]|nr:PilT/PilU family type 4a pilus ATPase [Candidatus Hydrogenedentota bacterium]